MSTGRSHPGMNAGRHSKGRGDQVADGEARHNPSGSKAQRRLRRGRGLPVRSWSARQAKRRETERQERDEALAAESDTQGQ